MPKRARKYVRCPQYDENLWIVLESEKDMEGNELLVCMTCKKRDILHRKGEDCDRGCWNYFYSHEE